MAKAWKMAKENTPANQQQETGTITKAPMVDSEAPSSSFATQELLSQNDDRDDTSESSDSDSESEKN